MIKYKVTIEPESPVLSRITSRNLFGSMCWAIRYSLGKEFLEEQLESNNIPIISSLYPAGCLPYPGENKYINISTEEVKGAEEYITPATHQHCSIDRNTKTSDCYWSSNEIWYNTALDFYISASDNYDIDIINDLVHKMLSIGIGAGLSTGHGRFKLIGMQKIESLNIDNTLIPTGYMVISEYIPCKSDPTDGVYAARVVAGKTVHGEKRKPVLVINQGAIFKGILQKDYIGQNVRDEATGTYTQGKSLVVPIDYNKYV